MSMKMRNIMRIVEALQYEMFPPNSLYHTTSPAAAFEILESKALQPSSDGFVSLSAKPHLHDISAHGAVLVFDLRQLYSQLEPVNYTEEWAHEHPAQAGYIAGEGWREQWEGPEPDEDGWEDEDAHEDAYREAEREAFFQKSDEDEWISLHPGQPIRFLSASVTGLIHDEIDDEIRAELTQMGYGHVKVITSS